MTKNKNEEKYSNIFYEITEDIIHKADFDEEVRKLIDESVLGIQKDAEECILESEIIIQEVAATSEQQ